MMAYQPDTSGSVIIRPADWREGNCGRTASARFEWPDLSPFVQGYVEAMFAALAARPCTAGLAKHEKIYISRLTMNRGGNYLIGTLLEEHLHLTQGLKDESRAFQDFLIDLVIKFAREAARTRQLRRVV